MEDLMLLGFNGHCNKVAKIQWITFSKWGLSWGSSSFKKENPVNQQLSFIYILYDIGDWTLTAHY